MRINAQRHQTQYVNAMKDLLLRKKTFQHVDVMLDLEKGLKVKRLMTVS